MTTAVPKGERRWDHELHLLAAASALHLSAASTSQTTGCMRQEKTPGSAPGAIPAVKSTSKFWPRSGPAMW